MLAANARVFDLIGGPPAAFLRFRVGVVFPAGKAPNAENVKGMVELVAPMGAQKKKFYCPSQGVDLLSGVVRAEYPVDPSVAHAPFAELLLNQRAGHIVWFGRFGETAPFSFDARRGHYYISLRINRVEDGGFVPLYISARNEEDGARYFCLEVEWNGETISVSVRQVGDEDVPEFLKFRLA